MYVGDEVDNYELEFMEMQGTYRCRGDCRGGRSLSGVSADGKRVHESTRSQRADHIVVGHTN